MGNARRLVATFFAGTFVLLAGCGSAGDSFGTGPADTAAARGSDDGARGSDDGVSGSVAGLRIRCELRTRGRSRISVDGDDLVPGTYRARVTSGSNSAVSDPKDSIGDEVEFDFDSDGGDIRAGATPIAPDFIQTSGTPDVTAEILDTAGATVVGGGADCDVRR